MLENQSVDTKDGPRFDDNGCSRKCTEYLVDTKNCRISNGDPLYELDMEVPLVPLYKYQQ